ncbi:hypothetical protein MVEN_02396200 [Mycena venus]|uniref:C2H2-type domain-containing protein n=1 Tax=Mycena venus TaxID=2733690 RepID=A0A8H7CEC8_9AGAR|nr:hypothetical protein MVEN_02396200 [Mycena venus]
MASTSTSRSPSAGAPIVKLPSIHEMFPEHLVPRAAAARPRASSTRALANVNPSPRNQFVPPPAAPPQQVYPSFSFEVLKSDPRSSSLWSTSRRAAQALRRADLFRAWGLPPILRAHAPPALITSSEGDGEMDVDGEEGEDGEGFEFAEEGKKHICPTCSKRFNRPSSLRIHVNTHTGATPFRCPHPSCGRAFNVNSNMRRHFRNHANDNNGPHSPTASSSSLSFNTHPPGPPLVTSFNSPRLALVLLAPERELERLVPLLLRVALARHPPHPRPSPPHGTTPCSPPTGGRSRPCRRRGTAATGSTRTHTHRRSTSRSRTPAGTGTRRATCAAIGRGRPPSPSPSALPPIRVLHVISYHRRIRFLLGLARLRGVYTRTPTWRHGPKTSASPPAPAPASCTVSLCVSVRAFSYMCSK